MAQKRRCDPGAIDYARFPLPFMFDFVRKSGEREYTKSRELIFGYESLERYDFPREIHEIYKFDSGLILQDAWLHVVYLSTDDSGDYKIEWMGVSRAGSTMPWEKSFPYYFTKRYD
jgi:hypothetical protein